MLSSLQQKAVWEEWLSAEIRANYFAELAGHYQRKQRFITWATLAFSSGAFATLISDWLPAKFRWIRPAAAFVIVALSIWSLTAKNERNAIECSDLHFKWNVLAGKFERLWDDMYSESAPDTLINLQERSAEISKSCTTFPNNRKRMLKWEQYVVLRHKG
jgi:hypothetical protein